MIIANNNVTAQIKHNNAIIALYHFDNNNKEHYVTLSEDGELKEWGLDPSSSTFTETGPCNLVRPSAEILIQNKHKIPKMQKNDFLSITKSILFKTS